MWFKHAKKAIGAHLKRWTRKPNEIIFNSGEHIIIPGGPGGLIKP